MSGRTESNRKEEDNRLAAARWVLAIDAGLEPVRAEAFHAWLAADPERAELISQQAELLELARQAKHPVRRSTEQAFRSRRHFLAGGAITTGVVALGAAALIVRPVLLGESDVPDSKDAYETATGQVQAIELADASRLWLDTRTHVSAHMTSASRELALDSGRLFVEVAHEPDRPFLVRGANFEARAVGTAFEATVFAGRTGVAVTVGVVRLTAWNGGKAIDLAAGQCAWLTGAGEVTRTTAAVRSIAAWRERRMVLSNRRLDAALAELSRYFDRPLVVVDQQLAARRVSLSFSIADLNAEDAARIIADVVGAEIADQANTGIVLSPVTQDAT